jgi:hypothetical protein
MSERRYECVMNYKESRLTVNVFTEEKISSNDLRPLALKSGIKALEEFGVVAGVSDIKLIGYKDCGLWPLF